VICPATVKINWKNEFDRWLVVKRQVEIFDGKTFNPNAEIGIINPDNISKHKFPKYDLVITDEGHYFQNGQAKRTKAWGQINASRKLVLTGSPLLNRSKDLFTILNYLDPANYEHFFGYGKRYCAGHQIQVILPPRRVKNKSTGEMEFKAGGPAMVWDFSGNSHSDELQRKLRSTLMIRRLKSEVLKELPPKTRQIIQLPADKTTSALIEEERDIYNDNLSTLEKLQQQLELAKVLEDDAAYMKAAEQLESAQTIMFEQMAKVRKEIGIKTVPYAIEHIGNILDNDQKVVCFAHHTEVIDLIAAAFPEVHARVTGATSATMRMENGKATNDRQKEVESFQNDPKCRLFIGQDQAAAEGITLTAASTVVFVEQLWNPGKTQQCEDRAHRIGQKESVLIQFLVIAKSVSAYMMETVIGKMNDIDKVLDRMTHDAAMAEPQAPVKTVTITKEEIAKQAKDITPEQIGAVHTCLKILAGLDQDYAAQRNGVGYSGADSMIGHSLASSKQLSPKQSVLGAKVIAKYHKQLPPDLYKKATGKESKAV
jgi:SWI/SNF-related matrix-associated actin-dependent regulator 1 of chromatin subfamily A